MIPIYMGFDQREACAYHVATQSIIDTCSIPVSISPIGGHQGDGSNAFTYSRFLIPERQKYEGWALWVDSDIVLRDDLADLWDCRDDSKAALVVKHDYECTTTKYIGTPMESPNHSYPRKNYSSVVLWNCSHPSNRILTSEFVGEVGGSFLHRFQWLDDSELGSLDPRWNHLVEEQERDPEAKLLHWTLGVPGFEYYARCDYHKEWNRALMRALHLEGERPEEVVRRAAWRSYTKDR